MMSADMSTESLQACHRATTASGAGTFLLSRRPRITHCDASSGVHASTKAGATPSDRNVGSTTQAPAPRTTKASRPARRPHLGEPVPTPSDSSKMSMDVVKKAMDDMKEATQAVGGPLDDRGFVALLTLMAKDMMLGSPQSQARLAPELVSPPISSLHARKQAEWYLEYVELCEKAYDMPTQAQWEKWLKAEDVKRSAVNGRKLVWFHKGGVCIPKHMIIRDDVGGPETRGKRRKRRLIVLVRGTAEMSDAAINISMVPGPYQYQGKTYMSHRGIVEAAAFLMSIIRPVLWRAVEQYRTEGVDVGSEVEVVLVGHSLGAATASIAALELQGEFGPRIPVRAIGFATPAMLSADLAAAYPTRRVVKTLVLGDDMIPRCSTRNLVLLKRRAEEVPVEQEVAQLMDLVKQQVTRQTSSWAAELAAMLGAKPREDPLPNLEAVLRGQAAVQESVDKARGDVEQKLKPALESALSSLLSGVLPGDKGNHQATLDQIMAEYQETLDAEMENIRGKLERLKREALQPLIDAAPPAVAPFLGITPSPEAPVPSDPALLSEEALIEGEQEPALPLPDNTGFRPLDLAGAQKEMERLMREKAALAETKVKSILTRGKGKVEEVKQQAKDKVEEVKQQAKEKVEEVLNRSSEQVGELTGKALDSVKWAMESWLKERGGKGAAATSVGQQQGAVEEEASRQEEERKLVALYPPGQVFWIRVVTPPPCGIVEGRQSNTRTGSPPADELPVEVRYELRRVRDPRFFDGIPLSPSLFSHHLIGSYKTAVRGLAKS